ncbi:hypothetical protein QBC44DRAFT_323914 [Cladorrhinum sp. PSN332]|nr:hypothetical protein QBC44DRAFT_323914 [Cladorrhinum sp. PSN332]
MATVVIVGTCDSKLNELLFLRESILQAGGGGVNVTLIDVGRHPTDHEAITISQTELLDRYYNNDCGPVDELPRGELVKLMSCLAGEAVSQLYSSPSSKGIHGIIAAGGSGNTSIAASVMRDALPLGFPKLIVSTVASGDTKQYIGESDIAIMYTVVDVAGTNSLLRRVLANAGAMIAGAARVYAAGQTRDREQEVESEKKRVGITMFGVTTPAVDFIREYLTSNYSVEVFVFHATGTGGKAMEKMVRDGGLDAVLDLTTTEVADYVAGGVMSAGEGRLSASVERGIPYLVSLGALDMVNFGGVDTLPGRYLGENGGGRKWYQHNPSVTLMRVDEGEAERIGRFIVDALGDAGERGRVKVVIPRGGLSLLSAAGQPFEDREVDEVLFRTVRDGLRDSAVEVIEDERDINDEALARLMAEELVLMMGLKGVDGMNLDNTK